MITFFQTFSHVTMSLRKKTFFFSVYLFGERERERVQGGAEKGRERES